MDEVVDLGFLATKDLSFDKHCDVMAETASQVMYNMLQTLSTSNAGVLLRAYKVSVRPILEYGTPVFSPYKMKSNKILEAVQNSFTRKVMIRELRFCYDQIPSIIERNHNFGLRTLEYRRKRNQILLFRRIIHHTTGIKMSDIMTLRAANTRSECVKYYPGRAKLSCRFNFFTLRSNTLYNNFKQKGTIATHLCSFKKFLSHHLSS